MSSNPENLHSAVDGAFARMAQARERFAPAFTPREVGTITNVATGIVKVAGLPSVGFEELLEFPGGVFGIAFNVDEREIGAVLLGEYWHLNAGDEVKGTGRVVDVPVGDALLGRVIDPLGRPLDGGGPIESNERLPVERPAAAIMDRAPVTIPLQSGLKVVDALIPIGRGQRELILGDRQTGKTALALDTILNQQDQDVLCVYCAIGQRASAVAKTVSALRDKGALKYTVVVVTEGNDPPGLTYLAPYAATSIAEHFMAKGRDAKGEIVSDTTASLRRQIASAGELQSVVRTMKALAASSIGQYEQSVHALADYYRTVQLGLCDCLRNSAPAPLFVKNERRAALAPVVAIVFGSDQGLVGQFNDVVADLATTTLATLPGKHQVWVVGERVHAYLSDAGLPLVGALDVPTSVDAIGSLVGRILVESAAHREASEHAELHLFYNRPQSGAVYAPVSLQLLPLDETWRRDLAARPWSTKNLPEVMGDRAETLRALIREYLFVSLFRACAESLASENASRLAAMQRADKNIDELLERLNRTSHRLRQDGIDEELFDVVSGYEALADEA